MDHSQRSKKLFQKFINDQCTPHELETLFWYLKHPAYTAEYPELLQQVWHKLETHQGLSEARSEIIFRQIMQGNAASVPTRKISKRPWYSTWQMAASLTGLLLIVAGIGYFIATNDAVYHHTAYGEIRTVVLPDQSTVTLNGNSTLSYRKDWDADTTREVWLEGEAFFEVKEVEVASEKNVKFVAHTPQLAIEVVGTAFNVNNRRGETRVVLSSGKINLSLSTTQKKRSIEMSPGELVQYSEEEQVVEQRRVHPQLYSSWKDRRLVFVNTPLKEIAQILEDTYGFEVVIGDQKLAKKRFNGEVTTDQVEVLFKAIASTFDIDVIRDEKKVVLQYKK